jgi:hypothetical protein
MIPSLVPRDDLMRANSAALLNLNLASTAGPSIAGFLVQVMTAPFAILVDAASYGVSAIASYLIREPARSPAPQRADVRLSAGLRLLFGHRTLAPLTASAAVAALAGAMQGPLTVLFLIRELDRSASFVGITLTVFGAAAVAGTVVAAPWCRLVGIGPSYLSGVLLASLNGVALSTGLTPVILLGQACAGAVMALFGVPQRTLRQSLAPPHLLGQVTASWRTVVIGGQTLGAAASGVLATAVGVRPTLLLSSAGMLGGLLIAALSPIRTLRNLPEEDLSQRSMR